MNPEPMVGQVWQSTDPRDGDRSLLVTHVNDTRAYVRNVENWRRSSIDIWRMTNSLGKRGYRLLLEEMPA